MNQVKFLITNGKLGTLDQTIVHYSQHPNGVRALQNAIKDHAHRTGLESWAVLWQDVHNDTANRWYPRKPDYEVI